MLESRIPFNDGANRREKGMGDYQCQTNKKTKTCNANAGLIRTQMGAVLLINCRSVADSQRLHKRAVPEELKMELHLEDVTTYSEALAMVLFNSAIRGNVAAAREIRESIEGRANQRRIAVGGEKVEVLVTWEKSPLLEMLPKDNSDSTNK
jgi:hypothetical protein